jgi:uncharacterized paraquat-inducible protein A
VVDPQLNGHPVDTIYRRLTDHLLTVHCPKCDFDAKQKVLTLLQHKKVVCPRCGSLNDVDTKPLEDKISSAQAKRDSLRVPNH